MSRRSVTMFLCGDVMLGRGVDQILPHPGDPRLHEAYVRDARHYVELAEQANGPIPRPVDYSWPWGDALDVLADRVPDVRVLNLETTIARDGPFAPGKAVHYRMSPANVGCLEVAQPDACVLANNHLLDFGRAGLKETLDTLADAGLRAAGAGPDAAAARRPAEIPLTAGGRVLVFAFGMPSSGIPLVWSAKVDRPGICVVPDASSAQADRMVAYMRALAQPDDVVVASIHWGSNWGYDVTRREQRFARRLIDGGIHVVHGHSSHHPRPIEVYRGKLILYGCGDFIDDYEGIGGYEEYRDDLRPLYLVTVDTETGSLLSLHIVPLVARRMRLHRATRAHSTWMRQTLSRISRPFGSQFELHDDSIELAR